MPEALPLVIDTSPLILGVPVLGTLGLVLQAKREGRLPAARPLVEQLVSNGMYLSGQVLDEALALVGE